jgi:TonB family protein
VGVALLGFTVITGAVAQGRDLEPSVADSSIARVRWPFMDILMVPDTCYGLLILAGPNTHTDNWRQGSQIVSFSVDPLLVLQWGSTAQALLRQPAIKQESDTVRYKATPRLQGQGSGFVILVKTLSRVPEDRRLQFIASDTAADAQWKTFVTAEDVTSLLTTIEDVVARAPARRPWNDSTLVSEADTGVASAVQTSVPRPHYPAELAKQGEPGRVWAQYIVGTNGRVEQGSIRILLADREEFATSAAAALTRAKFRPATRRGVPVRQRVFQAVSFR